MLLPIALVVLSVAEADHERIPYFARRYGVACQTCHALPPKLNAFGEDFRRRGYRGADLEARPTVPLAVWASSRFDALPAGPGVADRTRTYVNRIEVVSGGRLAAPWLSYFVEWRALSLETRGDGTLRDRSGRFEDLFVTASTDRLAVTVGQFRQIDQVDVSLRLGLSEPLILSASLPGQGGADARQQGLRAFAPAGRSPTVRAAWTQDLGRWQWTSAAALPFPGEFSVPLTEEALAEASNEIELAPKGLVLETFVRRGVASYGAHGFYDHPGRYLLNAVATGSRAAAFWTAVAGVEKRDDAVQGRWSIEGEYVAHQLLALGARVENRAGDGAPPALLAYVVAHFPGTRYTFRFTAEQRIQGDRSATFVELGAVF
jgi:hypothetical protein